MAVELQIDSQLFEADEGECLASVLLRQRPFSFSKHPIDGSPRAAFCMMGVCFECLVEVNGVPNQQACLITVERGMNVKRWQK